jgi:transposase
LAAPRRVRELSEDELSELDQLYRATNNADIRTRCQIALLSNEGYPTPEVAHLVRFSEDTVLYWIDRYAAEGVAGLEDRPRPGRPPKS